MEPGKRAVREMSAKGPHARIVYNDVRGEVILRPATAVETASDIKLEAKRYAPGDTVTVRPVVYCPITRRHRVLPEYDGTVVNWASGHYNVRSLDADEHGHGVRPCRVHELRPAEERMTGTAPWFESHQDVNEALATLRTAGIPLASLSTKRGGTCTDGAFVIPEPGEGNPGVRVSHLLNGWGEETIAARRNATLRAQERTTRNEALDRYAEAFRTVGWKVMHAQAATTSTRCVRHLVIWPPAST
ncbi:hypothetical protein [Streptomyces sp. S1D4-20]|uniref:hypothetical protein n=1 Tax=Streptomyces sp. S1D4-20 TaxID=2594462 RepID=UPI001165568D|nr:hypothetical protein [Streptomyces sp. S1D4-20]QDN54077.1 hypothetical protein FNV67_00410 [Streptomyces sp. S1D4-20]